uniref:Uncharacterized protein n=1 Tax=Romanomermis culicivorax TaxID=13658 RepID=A0A915IAB6_ROMCU
MRIHANARVLYVDTTNAVQPYRIAEILVANNHNFDGEKDQNPNLSLVVIDHIGTLLSPLVQKSVSKETPPLKILRFNECPKPQRRYMYGYRRDLSIRAELNEKAVKYAIKCRGITDIPDSPTQSSDLDL